MKRCLNFKSLLVIGHVRGHWDAAVTAESVGVGWGACAAAAERQVRFLVLKMRLSVPSALTESGR